MRLGIICPSEIAIRRFMPALMQVKGFEFVGLGVNSPEERYGSNLPEKDIIQSMLDNEHEKAHIFTDKYGGKVFGSYEEIISSDELDAIYIPLPPGLHYTWAEKALRAGKHVLIEKPATTSVEDTKRLVTLAKERGLALHENYMFAFHSQLDDIDEIIKSGELGEVRLYRVCFGFPKRADNDFRYVRALGGGALIDAGGYTIKYASRILGDTAKVAYAQLNGVEGYDVDIYGSGALINDEGTVVQIGFGMDNNYKCELEVWGSKACLTTGRILTAPAGFLPTVTIRRNTEDEIRNLSADDAFMKSIEHFKRCTMDEQTRRSGYLSLTRQAQLVWDFLMKSGYK